MNPNENLAQSLVRPIGFGLQQQVRDQTNHYIAQAQDIFQRQFADVEILFDLKGRSAGMFRLRNEKSSIRYNPYIFSKYFNENLTNTVPHEVAHFGCYEVYGLNKIRPHGREWKNLMKAFGSVPNVTANYDLTGIPLRQYKQFEYRCDCRNHQLSIRRHHWIVNKKKRYFCKFCEQPLRFVTTAV